MHRPTEISHKVLYYLHGNGSNKLESLLCLQAGPPELSILTFDFEGCLDSGGTQITYGHYEKHDIWTVLNHVSSRFAIESVVIWGKSMGAVAAFEFMNYRGSPLVKGLVLDSPFQRLRTCLENIGKQQGHMAICLAISLNMIESKVHETVGFELFAKDYLEMFRNADLTLPVLLAGSRLDDIVPIEEPYKFFSCHKAERELVEL